MAIHLRLPQGVLAELVKRDFECFICGKPLSGSGYEMNIEYCGQKIIRTHTCPEHMSRAMVLFGNLEQWLKELDKPPKDEQLLKEIDRQVKLVSTP